MYVISIFAPLLPQILPYMIRNMSYFSEFLKSLLTALSMDPLLQHNAQKPGSAEQLVNGMVRVLLLFWSFWGLLFFPCGLSWLGFCGCIFSYPLAMHPGYNWTQINGPTALQYD